MVDLKNILSGPLNHAKHEEEVLDYWDENHTFERSVKERDSKKPYVFYDGPPFATGLPHYGHLLASTAKDVVPRYWTMKGYRVERTWGWDCHGIPIENMIEGELQLKGGKKGIEEYGIANFNQACRASILRFDKEWQKVIRRLGRWVDMDKSYKTMDRTFMESVWWAFKSLYEKGLIKEGKKVILYCPRCSTPLSNFEIAMDNSYKEVPSHSLFLKFKRLDKNNEYFVAWTTTPWTLPGNVGLAVNPDAEYSLLETAQGNLWFASRLIPAKLKNHKILIKTKGKELVGATYEPLYNYLPLEEGKKSFLVCPADFVSLEDGTGIVHTAAIYGEDDYKLAVKENLNTVPMLDEQGKFLPFVLPLAGQYYTKTEDWIINDLAKRGLVYEAGEIMHSYPFCYRCGTALFYNAIPAYFVDIQKLKPDLAKNNQPINWYPAHLKNGRFGKGLETAPDWNISRSRYWGTPMPVWVGESGKKRVIGSIEELRKWAVRDPGELPDIHREYLDDIKVYVDDAKTEVGKRIPEVFDCWVESGSMPFASIHYPFENKAKFEARYPAQYIVEYIAQTRAWFYTLHVMSVALFGKPAFENAVTTGTILAEDGSKMSKSKKNYPDPTVLINKYGVDSLRLYLMSSTVMKGENLNFMEKEVDEIRKGVMNIWWNSYIFYRGVREKNDPSHFTAVHPLDRWILSKLNSLITSVTSSMDHYDVVTAARNLMAFARDLSNWYIRLSRERLKKDSVSRSVLKHVLTTYSLVMAPFAPFMAERIYQNLDATESVHLALWPKAGKIDQELEKDMMRVASVVEAGHAARKASSIRLRQPLASITIKDKLTKELELIVQEELNVKKVKYGDQFVLDTTLTKELKEEGEARDLMRDIQGLRKKQGLSATDRVIVKAPSWPANWEEQIKRKVNAVELVHGEVLSVSKS